MKLPGNLHVRRLPIGDMGKLWKVTVMVQKQVQLDRPLGPAEPCPIKNGQTQIDRGGIEADQLVLESELLFTLHLGAATFKQLQEDVLIKLPRANGLGPRCPDA
jgi:hypothetical protein